MQEVSPSMFAEVVEPSFCKLVFNIQLTESSVQLYLGRYAKRAAACFNPFAQ